MWKVKTARICSDMESIGLKPAGVTCKKCNVEMFLKPCPCFLRRKGFKVCAKCPKCGRTTGLKKK